MTKVFLRKVTSDPNFDHFFRKDCYTYAIPKGEFPKECLDEFLFTKEEWAKYAHFVPDFESINSQEILHLN